MNVAGESGDRLLLLPEIAAEMRSSEKTVRRRIMYGKLAAAFKEGGRWVMWRSALLAYLKRDGRKEASDESL